MDPHPNLTPEVIRSIGWLYLLLFAMNVFWTLRVYRRHESVGALAGWSMYTVMLGLVGAAHVTSTSGAENFMIHMPLWLKTNIDAAAKAEWYFILSIGLFAAVVWFRE